MEALLENSTKSMNTKTQRHTHIKMRISAFWEYLPLARSSVKAVAERIGLTNGQIESVTLALQEALTNVIKHSYGQPCPDEIVITLSQLQGPKYPYGALEISIRDYGKAVDPANIVGRKLEDIRPGGLGVHIIKSIMDECIYNKMPDKGMELTMIKIKESPNQ